ncbi:hypothetical protein JTB14_037229 [Gonioctena quinquepunctata]|nr:hypothetical protein JTB14_037229 [Gonioctena quinquepunctata]
MFNANTSNPVDPTNSRVTHSIYTVFSIGMFDTSSKWLMELESAFKVFGVPQESEAAHHFLYMGPNANYKIPPGDLNQKSYEDLEIKMLNTLQSGITKNFRFNQRKHSTALQNLATTCKFGDGLRSGKIQSGLLECQH